MNSNKYFKIWYFLFLIFFLIFDSLRNQVSSDNDSHSSSDSLIFKGDSTRSVMFLTASLISMKITLHRKDLRHSSTLVVFILSRPKATTGAPLVSEFFSNPDLAISLPELGLNMIYQYAIFKILMSHKMVSKTD